VSLLHEEFYDNLNSFFYLQRESTEMSAKK